MGRGRLMLVVLFGVVALGGPPLSGHASGPRPTAQVAVYRGAGGWGAAQVPAYERFLGRPVDLVLDYQATDTWANQEWPGWQAEAWQGRQVVLGASGIFPGSWDRRFQGGTVGWRQAARGDYDAHWRTLGQRLVATGQARAILRGAHEFNGGWFPHRVDGGEQADFIAAWRRWVTIMRSVPGQHFTFDWNVTVGVSSLAHPETAWPGDDVVDRVALDVYDGWYARGRPVGTNPSQAERDQVWQQTLGGPYGLASWHAFARAHRKHLSIPEWGLRLWAESDGLTHGGGDDASFVRRMGALIADPAWQVDYAGMWEEGENGPATMPHRVTQQVWSARSAFLDVFAGPRAAAVPPGAAQSGSTGAGLPARKPRSHPTRR